MWLLGLVGIAMAESEPCPPPELIGTVPVDGDAFLPAGTSVAVVFRPDGCGEPEVAVRIRPAEGGPDVATTLVADGEVVRAVPDAPLEAGDYVAEVTVAEDDPLVITFSVGRSFANPPPGQPAEVVLSAGRRCDPLTSRIGLGATFPEAEVTDRGVLRATVLTEDGEVAARSLPYLGEPEVALGFVVSGGLELCVALALEDAAGAVAWEVEPICAEQAPACEVVDERPEPPLAGLGCSTGPSGGLLLLPLLLLVTRRRGLAALPLVACSGPKDSGVDTGIIGFTTTVTVELDGDEDPTDPTTPTTPTPTDTGTPPAPSEFVPTDLTVPPPELAGERTFCWTLSEHLYQTRLYAVGGDSGTVVEVSTWPGNGDLAVTALAAYEGRLIGSRSLLWIDLDLLTGSYTGGNMDAEYEGGLAVVGTELLAITGDELRVYPDAWALVRGHETEARPGFGALENFTADGANLVGTELWAQNLTVLDAATGAVVSSTPLSLVDVHVDGLSMADGTLHLLDSEQAPRLIQLDPATGAELSRVDLLGDATFDPGGLWCEPR